MSKVYKHKDIDFSADFFKDRPENPYLYNVACNMNRLIKIHDSAEDYIPSDYPTLINTFEQLYKGIAKEMQILYPDKIKFSDVSYRSGHQFSHFLPVIDRVIPIAENSEAYNKVKMFLEEQEDLYTPTRYERHQSFDDFQGAFRRLEAAVYRLTEGIKKEISKSTISEEEEKELEGW